jgi:hypothetical protein
VNAETPWLAKNFQKYLDEAKAGPGKADSKPAVHSYDAEEIERKRKEQIAREMEEDFGKLGIDKIGTWPTGGTS